MIKKLIFEGAGWNQSDSCGDVGNSRIRTTFKNKQGSEIYLELIAVKPHKYSLQKQKSYEICGIVDAIYFKHDASRGYSDKFSHLNKMYFEWTKSNILNLINSFEVGGEFEAIEVSDDWNGFNITGEVES